MMKYLGKSLVGREVRFPLSENGFMFGTITNFSENELLGARIEWEGNHWQGYAGAPGTEYFDRPEIESIRPTPENIKVVEMPYRVI